MLLVPTDSGRLSTIKGLLILRRTLTAKINDQQSPCRKLIVEQYDTFNALSPFIWAEKDRL